MAGFSAQGATFTFVATGGTFVGAVTAVAVETPVAEVVDMTSITDAADQVKLVPTGAWSAGSVAVDYIATPGTADPQSLVRKAGTLTFTSPAMTATGLPISRQVILESATVEVRVNELVRGNLKFRVTDYTGT